MDHMSYVTQHFNLGLISVLDSQRETVLSSHSIFFPVQVDVESFLIWLSLFEGSSSVVF